MGAAQWNRGSRAVSESIFGDYNSAANHNKRVIQYLNESVTGTRKLFEPTAIRFDGKNFWLMNTKSEGWASYGFCYKNIRALLREWSVWIVNVGRDEHSVFYDVEPK